MKRTLIQEFEKKHGMLKITDGRTLAVSMKPIRFSWTIPLNLA